MSMYESINVRFNEPAMDHLLNEASGDVGRHLEVIGLKVQAGAKLLVKRRTGRLARSIYLNHARDARGQYIQVGSNVRYAFVVHEGDRPHIITAHAGRVLRFQVGGRIVYARLVHHPGSTGRKYLTIPLSRVVRG